jgi:hypothetical protein
MLAIFWSGSLNGRDHSENIHVDLRIILKRVLGKQDETAWNFIYLVQDKNQC